MNTNFFRAVQANTSPQETLNLFKQESTQQFCLHIETSLFLKIKEIAIKYRISLSDVMRTCIKITLENINKTGV